MNRMHGQRKCDIGLSTIHTVKATRMFLIVFAIFLSFSAHAFSTFALERSFVRIIWQTYLKNGAIFPTKEFDEAFDRRICDINSVDPITLKYVNCGFISVSQFKANDYLYLFFGRLSARGITIHVFNNNECEFHSRIADLSARDLSNFVNERISEDCFTQILPKQEFEAYLKSCEPQKSVTIDFKLK